MTGPIVGTITLSCAISTPSQMIIRPSGTGALNKHKIRDVGTVLTTGGVNNYNQVDEIVCDDASSFVGWNEPSTVSDLYLFSNVSLPSNYDIDSLIVTARNLYDHSIMPNYGYKILISSNAGSTIYKSPNLNVTNGYGDYWFWHTIYGSVSWAWDSQPSNSSPLTEGFINNLQIGIETSMPTQWTLSSFTCRPNGTGSGYEYLDHHPGNPGWQCVDDYFDCAGGTHYNELTSYYTSWRGETYQMTTSALWEDRVGLIHSVTVKAWTKCSRGSQPASSMRGRTWIITHGSSYFGTDTQLSEVGYFTTILSTTYTLNPNTGLAWTWAEVDAMEAGVQFWCNTAAGFSYFRVCAIEAEVSHEEGAQGALATSQLYGTLNLSINTISTCLLPKPEWDGIRVNQDIETMGLNFWSGNREVYALGRSSKRTQLSGTMWDGCTDGVTTCEGIISCIRTLAKLKLPITISGLRYSDLNVEYNIISFSWKRIQEKPNEYAWELELEFKQ